MPEPAAPGHSQTTDPDPDPVDAPLRPLPDRLVTELTAHQTLELSAALWQFANEKKIFLFNQLSTECCLWSRPRKT